MEKGIWREKHNNETMALSEARGVFPLDMELLSKETVLLHTILIHFMKNIDFLSHYFLHVNFIFLFNRNLFYH